MPEPHGPPKLSREKEAAEVSAARNLGCCDLHKCITLHSTYRQPQATMLCKSHHLQGGSGHRASAFLVALRLVCKVLPAQTQQSWPPGATPAAPTSWQSASGRQGGRVPPCFLLGPPPCSRALPPPPPSSGGCLGSSSRWAFDLHILISMGILPISQGREQDQSHERFSRKGLASTQGQGSTSPPAVSPFTSAS